ncbi:MAG TPA: IPExxxVDY family protein [Bacteroidia bacterium]|nr:IPExxxVDY family protein [Bacteroidia bacterium]
MAKKNVIRFDIQDELSFSLMAVSSGNKDYRLCFDLNKALGLHLVRDEDVTVPLTRPGSATVHSCYSCSGTDGEQYYLVSNKDRNSTGYFVPEMTNINYFFVVSCEIGKREETALLNKLRQIEIIQAAYPIVPASLKSAEAFLYLLEF